MSRNFRQSQLLDAFNFSSSNVLEQLKANFTNVRTGTDAPMNLPTDQDGNIYFDSRGNAIYVREGGTWQLASSGGGGSTASITQELNTLPVENEYTYTAIGTADYDQNNNDAFFDGTNMSLYFRDGYSVGTTLYGFTTAPVGATVNEPDLVLHQVRRTGIVTGGFRAYDFQVTRGMVPDFGPPPGTPAILQTLYTRGTSATSVEYLTKNPDDSYEFTELPVSVTPFDSTETYMQNDLVSHNGLIYRYIFATASTAPTATPSPSGTGGSLTDPWIISTVRFADSTATTANTDLHFVTFPGLNEIGFTNGQGSTRTFSGIPRGTVFPTLTSNPPVNNNDIFYLTATIPAVVGPPAMPEFPPGLYTAVVNGNVLSWRMINSDEHVGRGNAFPTSPAPELGDLFILARDIMGPPLQVAGIYFYNGSDWILAANIDSATTDEPAIIDNNGTPEFASGINAAEIRSLLQITLADLPDTSITPNARTFSDIQNPIDVDDSIDGDYIPSSGILRFNPQTAGARASFVVGTDLEFTLATIAQADVGSNILWSGRVTRSGTLPLNAGEVVEITVDTESRSFFTTMFTTPSTDGVQVPRATIETWAAWEETTQDAGVGIFLGDGTLTNQSYTNFETQRVIPNVAITRDSSGNPQLGTDVTASELRSLIGTPQAAGVTHFNQLVDVDVTEGGSTPDTAIRMLFDDPANAMTGGNSEIQSFDYEPAFNEVGLEMANLEPADITALQMVFVEGRQIGGSATANSMAAPTFQFHVRQARISGTVANIVLTPIGDTGTALSTLGIAEQGGGRRDIPINDVFATFYSITQASGNWIPRYNGTNITEMVTNGTEAIRDALTNVQPGDIFFNETANELQVRNQANQWVSVNTHDNVFVNDAPLPTGRPHINFTESNTISWNTLDDSVTDRADILGSVRPDSLNVGNLDRDNSNFTPGRYLTVGTNGEFSTNDRSDIVDHEFTPLARTVSWTTEDGFPASRWYSPNGPTPATTSMINLGDNTINTVVTDSVNQGIPNLVGPNNTIADIGVTNAVDPLLDSINSVANFEPGRVYSIQIEDVVSATEVRRIDNFRDSAGNDLTHSQALIFRSATTTDRGNLPNNQTWLTPNLSEGDPVDTSQFTQYRVTDYGVLDANALAPFGSNGIDFTTNVNQTITISSPMGISNITTELDARRRVFIDVSGATGVPDGSLMEVVAASSTQVTLAPHVFNLDTGEAVPVGMLPADHVAFSPMDAALYSFSQSNADDFVTHEIHTLTSGGMTSGNFLPNEEHITIRIPSNYSFNTAADREVQTGQTYQDTMGRWINRGTGSLVTVTQALGGLFINFNTDLGGTGVDGPVQVSPNANGYPYATIAARIGSTSTGPFILSNPVGATLAELFAPDGDGNPPNIYTSLDSTDTTLTFNIQGLQDRTGNTFIGRNISQSDISLGTNSTAVQFLTELGRNILTIYPDITINTAARVVPTDSTMAEIVLDTNQSAVPTINYTSNDVTPMIMRAAVADPSNPMGTSYTVSYMNMDDSGDSRNFTAVVSATNESVANVVTSIQNAIQTMTNAWIIDNTNNDLTFVSRDNRPAAANIMVNIVEPSSAQGDITLNARRISIGGRELHAFSSGLTLDSNGILTADAPVVRIAGDEEFRISAVEHTTDDVFTFGATPTESDAGTNANSFITALFTSRPGGMLSTAPFTDIPLDRDVYVGFSTNIIRFVPRGTLITYAIPSNIPTLTIGNIFDDIQAVNNQDLFIITNQSFPTEINFRAGTGIQLSEVPNSSGLIDISTIEAPNPIVSTGVTTAQVEAIRNTRVRFGDWILSSGFGFPDVTTTVNPAGIRVMITPVATGAPATHEVNVYRINSQDYYFVNDFDGGAWIAGTLTNNQTLFDTDLTPRVISSFGA